MMGLLSSGQEQSRDRTALCYPARSTKRKVEWPMRHCIYCRTDKDDSEFTLEHVIPQFLGGAYAPDFLKTRDVCRRCNSNLGLFVDASFEKNWMVSNWLRYAASVFYDPEHPVGLPLICMGNCDLNPPGLPEGYVCESWIGPLGEQIYWLRPHDERLFGFVGGNPRTAKSVETRAYFLFSERSHKDIIRSWLSFEQAFEGRKVKKIMCTEVQGANPADIGFVEPDELDSIRMKYFHVQCSGRQIRNNNFSINVHFDHRFLAKLAIGISYCLFGTKVLGTDYDKELQKGLWHKGGDDEPMVRGRPMFAEKVDPVFNNLIGFPNAVTITILSTPEGVSLNLNIGTKLNWTVLCTPKDILTAEDYAKIGHGRIILLVRSLQTGVHLDLPSYLAHKGDITLIPELSEILQRADKHKEYLRSL